MVKSEREKLKDFFVTFIATMSFFPFLVTVIYVVVHEFSYAALIIIFVSLIFFAPGMSLYYKHFYTDKLDEEACDE